MTVDELIAKLQEIKCLHGGDDKVIATGLHNSEAEIESVKRVRTDHMSHVEIETWLG